MISRKGLLGFSCPPISETMLLGPPFRLIEAALMQIVWGLGQGKGPHQANKRSHSGIEPTAHDARRARAMEYP